jgi:hypothetical protein
MRANWPTYLLVFAAVLLLIVDQRLDLLALVAPLSILVSLIARAAAGRTRQRRM